MCRRGGGEDGSGEDEVRRRIWYRGSRIIGRMFRCFAKFDNICLTAWVINDIRSCWSRLLLHSQILKVWELLSALLQSTADMNHHGCWYHQGSATTVGQFLWRNYHRLTRSGWETANHPCVNVGPQSQASPTTPEQPKLLVRYRRFVAKLNWSFQLSGSFPSNKRYPHRWLEFHYKLQCKS